MANIVIIGGGVAGLSAGIYSLLNGHSVSIFEKHRILGGKLTGWRRKGHDIDGCVHWLTGTNPNSDFYKMWNTVGVLDENTEVYYGEQLFSYVLGDKKISLYCDMEKTRAEMLAVAPEDEKEINRFMRAVETMARINKVGGENCDRKMMPWEWITRAPDLLFYHTLSIKQLTKRFKNEVIRGFLSALLSEKFSSVALIYVFSTITGKNGGVPRGGSFEIERRMEERFRSLGGQVFTGKEAVKINNKNGYATTVEFSDGSIASGDYMIVTTEPSAAFGKFIDAEMPYSVKKIYDAGDGYRFSSSNAAFSCESDDIPFRDEIIVDVPQKYRYLLRADYLMIREYSNENFAPEGKYVVQTLAICDEAACVDFINYRDNKAKYNEMKKDMAIALEEIITSVLPSLKGKLTCLDVWTPATYKRYTNAETGTFQSFILAPKSIPIPADNRVKGYKNLVLAGQWLQSPGGLPIALDTGRVAAMTVAKLAKRGLPTYLPKKAMV